MSDTHEELTVVISADGTTISYIYSDLLDAVFEDDERETKRASHVEPASSFGWDHADGWVADMSPVGGPRLYSHKVGGVKQPFKTRKEALEAEVAWLREHLGL